MASKAGSSSTAVCNTRCDQTQSTGPDCATRRRDLQQARAISDIEIDPRNFVMKDSRTSEQPTFPLDVGVSTASSPEPTTLVDVGPPTCFNTCFGVSREMAGEAVAYFCDSFGDKVFTTPADNSLAV